MTGGTDLSIARLKAARMAPYLTSALIALRPVEASGLGTFAVDPSWRLYVDPTVFEQWTAEQIAGVLLHEVSHLLRAHAERRPADSPPAVWNVAGDLEINDDLVAAGVPLPQPLTPQQSGLQSGKAAEQYLAALDWHHRPPHDCGSGVDGIPRAHDLPSDRGDGISPVAAEEIRRRVAEHIRAAGTAPGGLRDWADSILEPVVPWQRLLAQIAGRTDATARGLSTDHTFSRPSRRARPGGPLLPRLHSRQPRVVLLVDTSASISHEELAAAITEISAAIRAAGPLTVVWCDTESTVDHRVMRVPAEKQLFGGGGTDLRVGFDAALKVRPDLLVVLTDGHTAWPERAPPVRTLVVLTGNDIGNAPQWATWLHRSVGLYPSIRSSA